VKKLAGLAQTSRRGPTVVAAWLDGSSS